MLGGEPAYSFRPRLYQHAPDVIAHRGWSSPSNSDVNRAGMKLYRPFDVRSEIAAEYLDRRLPKVRHLPAPYSFGLSATSPPLPLRFDGSASRSELISLSTYNPSTNPCAKSGVRT